MTIPWQPMEPDHRDGGGPQPPEDLAAWAELFATTIAHLAAQLTMTQLRLRALATAAAETGAIDPAAVQRNLAALADSETGRYLRENLGPELSEAVEIDALERDVISFLRGQATG